jgi:hypothetical protein
MEEFIILEMVNYGIGTIAIGNKVGLLQLKVTKYSQSL